MTHDPHPDDARKAVLTQYLREVRDVLRWKLEGLDDYDVRRPLTPTGTNLLGIVKHVAICAYEYFGEVFDRPFTGGPVLDDDDPLDDMWAAAHESRENVLDLWRRAWEHADTTIAALDLDASGHVPWWRDGAVTLQRVLVHMIAETARHAGHADILREQVDGAVGLRPGGDNMPDGTDWPAHVARVEDAARAASGR